MKSIVLLTDIPDWTAPFAETLNRDGWKVETVDLASFQWIASEALPPWPLVFNRIAARPADGDPMTMTRSRDLLAAIELAGIPCINGARCHAIGASKALQASLFNTLGIPTPFTRPITKAELSATVASLKKRGAAFILKPNAGGRGRGITSIDEPDSDTFALDGCAVLQERIESGDGLIHRVEMLSGEILYAAETHLSDDSTDFCLGEASPDTTRLKEDLEPEIATFCRKIAAAASLDIGSFEYLVDTSGNPWFIDINPVSTFAPNAKEEFGFDPADRVLDWLNIHAKHTTNQ
ncbi:MAG: ATP-grasp domain-containing protein [Verrucomicrobiota bacterium]